ncbi:MAG: YqgE/AlgH family protein [Burkholderiaceae bacterium]|jgi:putative transcriptional regulator|nr:YqgE/AlgH family protein [Burkholderiaceae bacterium]
MADATQSINLTNHFLIAMPGMQDATFARSVVYVCEHTERGALGLIINKPGEINLADLFERVDLPLQRRELCVQPVFHGGPVQTERGFVLHEPVKVAGLEPNQSIYAATLTVPGGLEMTTSKDVLEALSSGGGPRRVLVMLGYSSWGEGQLESEIARNSWLTVDANADLVFDAPVAARYDLALRLLGLEAWTLSPDAGHA